MEPVQESDSSERVGDAVVVSVPLPETLLATDSVEISYGTGSTFVSPFEKDGIEFESDDDVALARATRPSTLTTQDSGVDSRAMERENLMREIKIKGPALKDLTVGQMLGVGSFGSVYRGHHDAHGEVAIKLIPMDRAKNEKSLNGIKSEIQAGMALKHPNIAQIYETHVYKGKDRKSRLSKNTSTVEVGRGDSDAAAVLDSVAVSEEEVDEMFKSLHTELSSEKEPMDVTFLLTQEYCNGGTLSEALQRGDFEDADIQTKCDRLRSITLNVAYGIQYMHQHHIVHRDLSNNNVMLHYPHDDPTEESPRASDMTAKLIDFGRASINAACTAKTDGLATIAYAAPELMSDGQTSKASDIFSLGVLIWEVWTGEQAWEDSRAVQIIFAICRGDRLRIPEDMPADVADLTVRCWSLDPHDRPSIEEVIQVLEALPTSE